MLQYYDDILYIIYDILNTIPIKYCPCTARGSDTSNRQNKVTQRKHNGNHLLLYF